MIDIERNSIKLIDFGDSVKYNLTNYVYHPVGNIEFYAPEIIQSTPVSYTTDIWPVAIITYVLFSGVSPFLDDSNEETSNNILRLDYIFPAQYFNEKCDLVKHFIKYILIKDQK